MTTERDIRNQIAFARDKGLEEGMKKGFAQGIAQRNIEIARALLNQGVDTAIILQSTGITEEQLKTLSG